LYEFGPYRLNPGKRLLSRGQEPVQLPAKALEVLVVLVQHRGDVVSKDVLMQAVWPNTFVEEANVGQNIFILRRALGETVQDHRYIVTIPGRGYRFVADVREISEGANGEAALENPAKGQDSIATGPSTWIKQALILSRVYLGSHKRWLILLAMATPLIGGALWKSLPRIARFYNNRGVRLQRSGQIKAAIEDYQQAISLNAAYAEAHYNLADAYEEVPDYEKAVIEYQRAIDADLNFYQAYNNLSRLYILHIKDYGNALRLLERAMSLQPPEPTVQYSLRKNYGWVNLELHQLGQAEKNLRSALALRPDGGAAHCLLAKLLDTLGNPAKARDEWSYCLAYSLQPEVEPEWRIEAQENLAKEQLQ
jgi:DNA-binding winged helix-turn-helix (wHTH) protein/Flp pilus assembly protein TadD